MVRNRCADHHSRVIPRVHERDVERDAWR
jgi:hypothetical protein